MADTRKESGNILAIVEPHIHPHEVVERAAWLARSTGSALQLLLCDSEVSAWQQGWLMSADAREIAEKIAADQKEMIDALAENIRDTEVSVSTDVLEERPLVDAIQDRIASLQPLYVVKGTEHHEAAQRSIIAHADWQLIRTCSAPLYFAKSRSVAERPVIVAAVDPTHEHDKPAALDDVIVKAAKRLIGPAGGELHLLHTYARLAGTGAKKTRTFKPIKLPIDEIDQRIKKEHRQKLDKLAGLHAIDAEYVHQLPGRSQEIIPKFCRTHSADVIVMGAMARWGLKRAIIGSTTERLLDLLPCDVLVVR